MTVVQILILAIIGLMAGIFSGTFGVGGAIIVIPALIFFLGLSQHQAQGTSLAFMIPPETKSGRLISLNKPAAFYFDYENQQN